jgi:hypothetical protein
MKQVLILRKKIAIATVLIGLLFAASSFTFGPVEGTISADNGPQKKEQRVKVIINKNGKETKIDTTFNFADEKTIQVKVDSMLKKMEINRMEPNMKNIVIHRRGKHMSWNSKEGDKFPGKEQFDIMVQVGDSGKCNKEKRVLRIDEDGDFSGFSDAEGDLLPPPPPPPPPHSVMMIQNRFDGDPYSFDTKDESVISYEKKDIGNGLEKITIIRKKKADQKVNNKVSVKVESSDDSKK